MSDIIITKEECDILTTLFGKMEYSVHGGIIRECHTQRPNEFTGVEYSDLEKLIWRLNEQLRVTDYNLSYTINPTWTATGTTVGNFITVKAPDPQKDELDKLIKQRDESNKTISKQLDKHFPKKGKKRKPKR